MLYILGMAKNTATGRWHPMVYDYRPFPGPGPHSVERYKSAGHHTEGFATLEEAKADQRASSDRVREGLGYTPKVVERIVEWDGVGSPVDILLIPPDVAKSGLEEEVRIAREIFGPTLPKTLNLIAGPGSEDSFFEFLIREHTSWPNKRGEELREELVKLREKDMAGVG